MALAATACTESAEETVRRAIQGAIEPDSSAFERRLDPDYQDAIGDLDRLRSDLEDLRRSSGRVSVQLAEPRETVGATRRTRALDAELTIEASGDETLRLTGPQRFDLVQRDRLRIKAGMLTTLRDVRDLIHRRHSLLEQNDVEGLTALLHPHYRDGDVDRAEAATRIAAAIPNRRIRMRASLLRIDVRQDLVHVDEHYRLEIDGKQGRAAIARLTLRRSAGRYLFASGLFAR